MAGCAACTRGEASADDVVHALSSKAADSNHSGGAAHRHFQGEVLDYYCL